MMKIKKTWYFVAYTGNNDTVNGNIEIGLFDKHFDFKKAIDIIIKQCNVENALITFFSKLYEEEYEIEDKKEE